MYFSSGTDATVVCNNGVLLETKKTEEDLMVPLFVLRLPFLAESHTFSMNVLTKINKGLGKLSNLTQNAHL